MDNFFNVHRSPVEELKELYLETHNKEVLNRLIDKAGLSILLELDTVGFKIFSDCVFLTKNQDLLFNIKDYRKLKSFLDYVIIRFDEELSSGEDDFANALLDSLEVFNFTSGYTTKAIMQTRNDFLSKLLLCEKNSNRNMKYNEDIMDAIIKNKSISTEWILEGLLKVEPKISVHFIKNLIFRLDHVDIFNVVNTIGKVKDSLYSVLESGNHNLFNIEDYLTEGIDTMLEETAMNELIFGLFVSVEHISTNVIYYRKDEFVLLLERLTILIYHKKEDIDFYIENTAEREGMFPLGEINDEISKESLDGLVYCLYHGSTIASYQIVKDDRFLMKALSQVATALGLYIYMEILPDNWLESDEYYKLAINKNKTIDSSKLDNLDLDDILNFE